jgi:hypothetical protein
MNRFVFVLLAGLASAQPAAAQGSQQQGLAAPAARKPAGSIELCIADLRYQIGDARHTVGGMARNRDGDAVSYVVGGDGMFILRAERGGIPPMIVRDGFIPGAQPGIAGLLQEAAIARVWLKVDYDMAARAGNVEQKVRTVTFSAANAGGGQTKC